LYEKAYFHAITRTDCEALQRIRGCRDRDTHDLALHLADRVGAAGVDSGRLRVAGKDWEAADGRPALSAIATVD
jgi:hypothetical protein